MRLATMQTRTVVSQAIFGRGTARDSRRTPMPPALTPELALDYLRELSADVTAGVVLAADGQRVAPPPPPPRRGGPRPPGTPPPSRRGGCSPRSRPPTRPRSRPATASSSPPARAGT